ncbi:MAG: glycosyltransferase, partial [Planctomycetota bacterium]
IPNGIEIPPMAQTCDPAARETLRNELKLPADAFVAGYIGRLAKQKRVEDLIWAVETLRQIRPKLFLVIVGDGPERQRLENFARDVGCLEHVRFLGHREDASRWLKLMDVFCLASSFEGMSNSVMEAMSVGKPVIASDIPANRELVLQSETGFLPKLADTVGFMQFLRCLMDQPGLCEKLGSAGRDRIEKFFSVSRMVESYVEVYRSLQSPPDGHPIVK